MWDLIVSVPDHCLSFYLKIILNFKEIHFTLTSMVMSPEKYRRKYCYILIKLLSEQSECDFVP